MSLLYIEKIPSAIRTAFAKKVETISAYLGIHPDWLMQVMWAESKLKPSAANRQGKDKHLVAAGLLQFTTGSGIVRAGKVPSIGHILSMSALDQLDLVKWYFTPYRKKMRSYYDVYAVTFFPALVGKPDEWVLQTKTLSAATIARQNPAISKGKARITVADFKRYTVALVPQSLRSRVFGAVKEAAEEVKEVVQEVREEIAHVKAAVATAPPAAKGVGTGIIIGICLLGWFFLNRG